MGPQGPQGNVGPQGPQGVQGPPGPSGGTIFAGSFGLPILNKQVPDTECSQNAQDETNYGDPIDLLQGYYRVVFVGTTSLAHRNGGFSEVSIQLLPSGGGQPITELTKSASSNGAFGHSFYYVWMPQAGQIQSWARASTSCGSAYLDGVLAFERVSD
jgi:hypothetical protein